MAVDVKKIIKDLGDTNWSTDNESQMKAVQLLKGLSLSDDPKSNEFMKAVDAATTSIASKVLGLDKEEKKEAFEKKDSKEKVDDKKKVDDVDDKEKKVEEKKKAVKEQHNSITVASEILWD